jgi:hypothetical protein
MGVYESKGKITPAKSKVVVSVRLSAYVTPLLHVVSGVVAL